MHSAALPSSVIGSVYVFSTLDVCIQIIIFNTKFIIFNTKVIHFNANRYQSRTGSV